MTATATIAFASEAFAKRLANLLSDQRDHSGRSVRALARSSGGRFTARELRAIEAGETALSEPLAVDLGALYGVDLAEIVQERLPLVIRPHGVVSTGGVSASFTPHDPTSLLVSYLRLVRRLRNAEEVPSITLRRDDVESLAAYLDVPGERIIERLAGLMGATRVQRRAMVATFVAGAVVIGLVGTATAAIREPTRSSSGPDSSAPSVTVADVVPNVLATVPSSARAVFDVATGRVTAIDSGDVRGVDDRAIDAQASDTKASDTKASDTKASDGADDLTSDDDRATGAPFATSDGGPSAGVRRSAVAPTTGPPSAEQHPDPSLASPDPAPAPPDGGSSVDPPTGVGAAAAAAEAARLAADRDAAVVAAAQTAADADAARLAAEQAAAQAKADRIAAERAAAEAAAVTTTTAPTSAPTVTPTV